MSNKNLNTAKKQKNDEFFTKLSDIENELQHYSEHLKDKIVYCNCDAEWSNFYIYFKTNFEKLGLKKLITSCYNQTTGCGSFDSVENIKLLKECDIVVTNPPFSKFIEFVAQLEKYNKKYLIIGNMNAITYKETFKLIKESKLWLGVTTPKIFEQPDKTIKKFGNICWFTNLKNSKLNEKIKLTKEYNHIDYPKFDNFDAINVDKIKDIPKNYYKAIAVPISFLYKYNTEQFEILGLGRFYINGKVKYVRIIIKNKIQYEL